MEVEQGIKSPDLCDAIKKKLGLKGKIDLLQYVEQVDGWVHRDENNINVVDGARLIVTKIVRMSV